MPVLDIDLANSDGSPAAGAKIQVDVVTAGGGASDGEKVISGPDWLLLDDNGQASPTYDANTLLSPEGTFYRFTVPGRFVRCLRIPDVPGPVSWADDSLIVVEGTVPGWTPLAGPVGPAGGVVALNDATVLLHDDFERADGAPGTAPTGQVWATSGGGTPALRSGQIICTTDGFGYLGTNLGQTPTVVGLRASVILGDTVGTSGITIACGHGPDISGNINNSVHCFMSAQGVALQLRVSNATVPLLFRPFLDETGAQVVLDAGVEHDFSVAYLGDVVTATVDGAMIAALQDSRIPGLVGSYVYWEPIRKGIVDGSSTDEWKLSSAIAYGSSADLYPRPWDAPFRQLARWHAQHDAIVDPDVLLPWSDAVPIFGPYSTTSGFGTLAGNIVFDGHGPNNGYIDNDMTTSFVASTQRGWDRTLAAGNYNMWVYYDAGAAGAQFTITVGSTVWATIDSYHASTQIEQMVQVNGTLAFNGLQRFKINVTGRNGSNTTGYQSRLRGIYMARVS